MAHPRRASRRGRATTQSMTAWSSAMGSSSLAWNCTAASRSLASSSGGRSMTRTTMRALATPIRTLRSSHGFWDQRARSASVECLAVPRPRRPARRADRGRRRRRARRRGRRRWPPVTAAMKPGSMSSPTMVLERRAMVGSIRRWAVRRGSVADRPAARPSVRTVRSARDARKPPREAASGPTQGFRGLEGAEVGVHQAACRRASRRCRRRPGTVRTGWPSCARRRRPCAR